MKIGVFCSGGDAPGMNACVRAVVRAACRRGIEVTGILRGYHGLLNRQLYQSKCGESVMTARTVSGWSQYGGAILLSSRSEEFRTEAGQKTAAAALNELGIEALVAIGGDGTFHGAMALARHWDGQIVGCPGTIDNDLLGTDYTIGFSTAVRTAVEAVDKVRDTASSHDRMFLIEVMGRHSGYIGAYTALASGAEVVVIPETETNIERIIRQLNRWKERGKMSLMMIVSEGDETGGAEKLHQQLIAHDCPYKTRMIVLGHLQRGGVPTAEDRRRATIMGSGAVAAIARGESGIMIGTRDDICCSIPFAEAVASHRPIPNHLLELLEEMAT